MEFFDVMPDWTKRLVTLTALLTVGFSLLWVMSRSGERKLSRLSQGLPEYFDGWEGRKREVSQRELEILAEDTEFARMGYDRYNRPSIEASVVFSGRDINNSIHRPERCLQAQGWNFVRMRKVVLKGVLPDGGDLPVKELVCVRPSFNPETKKPYLLPNGQQLVDTRVQYYTFFGHKSIVEEHYGRTFADMRDRLFEGYDQQWAYATFSAPVMKAYADQGINISSDLAEYDLDSTGELLKEFIKGVLPYILDKEKR